MEKLKKEKHSHKATTILKNIIFACIMLAPFISVLVRSMYVICNPNAKDSYTGSVSYLTTQNVNTFLNTSTASETQEFVVNNQHTYKLQNYNLSGDINTINYNSSSLSPITNLSILIINVNELKIDNVIVENAKCVVFNRYNTYFGIRVFDVAFDVNYFYVNQVASTTQNMYMKNETNVNVYSDIAKYSIAYSNGGVDYFNKYNISISNSENNIYYQTNYSYLSLFEKSIFYVETTLSNAFEYSINNLENNDLYNWSKQLGIYTPLNNMIEGMGANSTISMLLAYWSILTAIYIVFDIIIWCFTKITHFISAD